MATIIILKDEPSDAEAVLSSLRHDVDWLMQISNEDPASLVGREEQLYSLMNAMQFVTSRFARII